jgi:hypothetical protein
MLDDDYDKILYFIAINDNVKAVNKYENDTDKFYITKDDKFVHIIRWYHYEALQKLKHKSTLLGQNICEMLFIKE